MPSSDRDEGAGERTCMSGSQKSQRQVTPLASPLHAWVVRHGTLVDYFVCALKERIRKRQSECNGDCQHASAL
jgi:hypothetical protein